MTRIECPMKCCFFNVDGCKAQGILLEYIEGHAMNCMTYRLSYNHIALSSSSPNNVKELKE